MNFFKKETRALSFENSITSVSVKAECISTQLHDKSSIYMNQIKSARKRHFEEIGDPGPS